jgi:hypothetical protein
MPAGILVSGAISNALSRDISKFFFDEYPRQSSEHDKIAKFKTADGNYEKHGVAAGIGSLVDIPEGEPLTWHTYKQGSTKTVYFTPVALGVQVTEIALDDDRQGIVKQIGTQLAKGAAYMKELKFWDLLNSGFVTTTRVGIDGKALFSAAHTRIDFPTAGNNLSTAAALSESTLTAAIDTFEALTNEKGIPIKIKPKYLLIPWQLKWVAKRLTLSELRPGYGDNDVNVLKDEGIQYIVIHYFTSATAWFLVSDEHDLNFIWRKQLAMKTGDDMNTGNALFKLSGRLTCDFWDWVGVYGNQGA